MVGPDGFPEGQVKWLDLAVKMVPPGAKPAEIFGAGGHLNPDWVEWLMGWPVGWTSLDPLSDLGEWFNGAWWDVEPVPRVTTDKTNRSKRLRTIGNGQVPACVVLAFGCLREWAK